MKRKGQVTIFIMVGIVILLGASVVLYAKSRAVPTSIPIGQVERQQYSRDPITNFVRGCLHKTAYEGLQVIGAQGGYAYPETKGLRILPHSTASNSVDFPKGSGITVPYWWYLKSGNGCSSCSFASEMPYLKRTQGQPNIEDELSLYISRNIDACVQDFKVFSELGWDIRAQNPVAEARFVGTTLFVKLYYELEARNEEQELDLDEFSMTLNTNFPLMYAFGQRIVGMQRNLSYLEKHTMNIVAAYSGVSGLLPPLSARSLAPGAPSYWMTEQVRQELKNILMSYTGALRFEGAKNYRQVLAGSQLVQGLYNLMVIPSNAIQGDFSDMNLDFAYQGWPIYLNLNGGQAIIGPEQGDFMMDVLSISMKRYSTNYDLSYPVVATIEDPDEGLVLNFAIEVNIRDNLPLVENLTMAGNRASTGSSLLFSPNNPTANITVKARSDNTGEVMPGVLVGYKVGNEFSILGKTMEGETVIGFPAGTVGVAIFRADGYMQAGKPIAVSGTGDSQELQIDMVSLRNPVIKVEKVLREKKSGVWETGRNAHKLEEDETADIMLERVNGPGETEFITYAKVKGNSEARLSQGLAPGKYKARIILTKDRELYIPPTRISWPKWHRLSSESVTIENQTLEAPVITGGLVLEERPLVFLGQNLDRYNTIVFRVLSAEIFKVPTQERRIEDIKELTPTEETSSQYRTILLPRYSNG